MPQSQKQSKVEWVSEHIIRQIFNERGIFAKVQSGELVAHMKKDSHPKQPLGNEPICTRSQILFYCEKKGKPVAIVHQYLRPDGTIGASGLPDPKRLFFKDRIVSVRTRKPK